MKTEVYYFISNSDNQIHKTDEQGLSCEIDKNQNPVTIQILSSGNGVQEREIIDEVNGYETLGDLYESMNSGGNDVE